MAKWPRRPLCYISSVRAAWDIFIFETPLLLCICDFLISSVSSECHSPPPPSLRGGPIYHWPKEGLHFVCFWASPSISCSPNERGYGVPAGPRRFKGPRSPVSKPTWGSNYLSAGPLRDAPPAGQSNSHTLDLHSWVYGLAFIIREAPKPGCRMTQDEGDATRSAQHALALVAGIGESIGGSMPNSADERRKWGNGRGGALTGRRMNRQREINNEGEVGSRWPAAGLPRRDRDQVTSRLAITRGHPLVTYVHAVTLSRGWGRWLSVKTEKIAKALSQALCEVLCQGNGAKKVCFC